MDTPLNSNTPSPTLLLRRDVESKSVAASTFRMHPAELNQLLRFEQGGRIKLPSNFAHPPRRGNASPSDAAAGAEGAGQQLGSR